MKSTLLLTGITVAGIVFAGVLMSPSPESYVRAATTPRVQQEHLPASVAPVLHRACRDCHSNDTVWPWYSEIPPLSFMIRHDVEAGRAKFNFSQWADGSKQPTANQVREICDAVSDGSMPPKSYRMMHQEARLSSADVDTLCGWTHERASQSADADMK